MTTVALSVRRFIGDAFYVRDVQSLATDASLLDLGIIDSTGVLELTAFLESDFGIQVTDEEIIPENLDTIDRIVSFVHRKRTAEERRSA